MRRLTVSKILKVGIIGANWGLLGHLPAWQALPGVEVLAICTAHQDTAEKAAREHGIPRAYWDYHKMMADPDIDIIDVGTQPRLRYDMVMAALAAGKHVYNANPFAVDLPHAKRMLDTQRQRGLVGQIDAQFQWVPQIARMKELISEGYLGDLFSVICHCHYPLFADGDIRYPFVAHTGVGQPYYWLGDASSGASVLRNLGGHCLHGLIHLFGEIDDVAATLDTFVKEWRFPDGGHLDPQTADTAQLMLRFRNGGVAQINTSWVVADAPGFSIEAYGSKGRLRLESSAGFPDTGNTHLYAAQCGAHYSVERLAREIDMPDRLTHVSGTSITADDPRPVIIPMLKMFEEMARAIRAGDEARPSFGQAYHVQQVVEAAEIASAQRRWVRIAEMEV
jgi:predicted dehydrogenase